MPWLMDCVGHLSLAHVSLYLSVAFVFSIKIYLFALRRSVRVFGSILSPLRKVNRPYLHESMLLNEMPLYTFYGPGVFEWMLRACYNKSWHNRGLSNDFQGTQLNLSPNNLSFFKLFFWLHLLHRQALVLLHVYFIRISWRTEKLFETIKRNRPDEVISKCFLHKSKWRLWPTFRH